MSQVVAGNNLFIISSICSELSLTESQMDAWVRDYSAFISWWNKRYTMDQVVPGTRDVQCLK